jgi:hypothetical protein
VDRFADVDDSSDALAHSDVDLYGDDYRDTPGDADSHSYSDTHTDWNSRRGDANVNPERNAVAKSHTDTNANAVADMDSPSE